MCVIFSVKMCFPVFVLIKKYVQHCLVLVKPKYIFKVVVILNKPKLKHKLKKAFIANTFHLCQFRDGFYLKSHKQSKNACKKPNTVHLLRILKQTNYENE